MWNLLGILKAFSFTVLAGEEPSLCQIRVVGLISFLIAMKWKLGLQSRRGISSRIEVIHNCSIIMIRMLLLNNAALPRWNLRSMIFV